jgi:hypothetical protein
MARQGERKLVRPLDKRTRTTFDEIGGMGQGLRRFIAWLWQRHDEVHSAAIAGSPTDIELRSKGFVFLRRSFLGADYSPQQSAEVSRWLKMLVKRGMILPFSRPGKHITHVRLTPLGQIAGAFYTYFGYRSPKELDIAVKFSSYWQRRELQEVKRRIMFPHDSHGLRYATDLPTVAANLEAQIRMRQSRFIDGLMRCSPERRAELIDLGRKLRDLTRRHDFMDGPLPMEFCDPPPVSFEDTAERDRLSIN